MLEIGSIFFPFKNYLKSILIKVKTIELMKRIHRNLLAIAMQINCKLYARFTFFVVSVVYYSIRETLYE